MADWRKKRLTMRHYDRSAKVYDAQYYEEQEAKIKAALSGFSLEKGNIVLDAGCGTGLLFPHIAERVKFVLGVDISASILKEAMKQVKQYSNTALIRADVEFMPFQSDTFDVAFALTLLQNTHNPLQTLKEIQLVTKQNATLVVTGLRKAFSRKEFTQLLRRAKLRVNTLKLDENLKEYIAICTESSKKTLKEPKPLCNSPRD